MLLYLTSNQKSGLIDGVTREMLMPSKKLVGKFSLKSFVTRICETMPRPSSS